MNDLKLFCSLEYAIQSRSDLSIPCAICFLDMILKLKILSLWSYHYCWNFCITNGVFRLTSPLIIIEWICIADNCCRVLNYSRPCNIKQGFSEITVGVNYYYHKGFKNRMYRLIRFTVVTLNLWTIIIK